MSNPTALRLQKLKELEEIPQYEMSGPDFMTDFRAHLSDMHSFIHGDPMIISSIRQTILDNEKHFKDAVVLDIGCSPGLLSLLAAKIGAKKVIAFDNSNVTQFTKQIVKDNNLEHIITVIRGDLETLELPEEITQVDIIVSKWVGGINVYYKSVMPWVLIARDRWLKTNGLIIPDHVDILLAGMDEPKTVEEDILWWTHTMPYNFNMKSIVPSVLKEPCPMYFPQSCFGTECKLIHSLDLNTVDRHNLGFEAKFNLKALHNFNFNVFSTQYVVGFPFNWAAQHDFPVISSKGKIVKAVRKYTGFFLKEYEIVKGEEEIYGTFKMDEPFIEDGIITKLRYTITWNVDGEHTKKFNQEEEYLHFFTV